MFEKILQTHICHVVHLSANFPQEAPDARLMRHFTSLLCDNQLRSAPPRNATMDAARKAAIASMIEADDSEDPTTSEKNQLIDQLVNEYTVLKKHIAEVRNEPDCEDLHMEVILRLNRDVVESLCKQIGRSFEALGLDEKTKQKKTEKDDEETRKVEKNKK